MLYTIQMLPTFLLMAILAVPPYLCPGLAAVSKAVQSQTQADPQRIKRPNSKPYTGALSIF